MKFDEYKLYLPKQEAVLVGQIKSGASELAGQPAYYMHSRGDVVIGELYTEEDEEILTPLATVECGRRIMADNVRAFDQLDLPNELSSVGEALLDAWKLISENNVLGDKQGHVYVLRDIHEFDRGDTATILGIKPTTVDNHLYDARDNVKSAQEFNQRLEQLNA